MEQTKKLFKIDNYCNEEIENKNLKNCHSLRVAPTKTEDTVTLTKCDSLSLLLPILGFSANKPVTKRELVID